MNSTFYFNGINTIFSYRIIHHTTILVLVILSLASCSSTRLLYEFFDNFIEDEVSFFVEMNKEENILMSQQVSEAVSWHRSFMLPSYSEYLIDAANMLENGNYDEIYINKIMSNGKSLIEETIVGLTPYASKFLMSHQSTKAINYMEKKMEKRRKERLKEISQSDEILYSKRLDRLKSNFERFFGSLTDKQVDLIKAYATATLHDSKVRLQNRTLRQRAFIEFMRTQPTLTELNKYLNKLLLSGHQITNPSYESFSQISLKLFSELLVNVLIISSKTQREKIKSKLRDYAKDFDSISSVK